MIVFLAKRNFAKATSMYYATMMMSMQTHKKEALINGRGDAFRLVILYYFRTIRVRFYSQPFFFFFFVCFLQFNPLNSFEREWIDLFISMCVPIPFEFIVQVHL